MWKSLFGLQDLSWIKIYSDYRNFRTIVRITHRNINIYEPLSMEYSHDMITINNFIVKRFKEIDYYLDAVWC